MCPREHREQDHLASTLSKAFLKLRGCSACAETQNLANLLVLAFPNHKWVCDLAGHPECCGQSYSVLYTEKIE